jgi:hypothetical protein
LPDRDLAPLAEPPAAKRVASATNFLIINKIFTEHDSHLRRRVQAKACPVDRRYERKTKNIFQFFKFIFSALGVTLIV